MGSQQKARVSIRIEGAGWQKKSRAFARLTQQCLDAVLAHEKLSGNGIELSAVLCDDGFMQGLNKQWRGKDKPTNVLSFPAYEPAMLKVALASSQPVEIGDLVISGDTVTREATEQGKELAHHMAHMMVHGILHLLGHDHEKAVEADRMEAKEIKILNGLGVNNPYL